MKTNMRMEFLNPSDEFTPIPFWFWNDELSESEITRQIDDFRDKGVMGFVIHPRKGMPKSIPYLSDKFMHYVQYAVEEAHKRGMKVVLYDEAMYPSGSAHGLVVKENPEYATRALRMVEGKNLPQLEAGDNLLAVIAAECDTDGKLLEKTLREISTQDIDLYDSVFCLIETYSEGTIRGIHIGEDDLEEDAPPSADLLNPDAMAAFIRITYDRYFEVLQNYFEETVIGMFTDEPCVLGRCGKPGCKEWTIGFAEYWKQNDGKICELPLLWKEASDGSHVSVRKHFERVVYQRLKESYYEQLSTWCTEHHVSLTGHPEKSEDMGVLKYFHIPGQDVVWRWVAPENETRLVGAHATMGKCSSDAARHYGRRRNSNECFGCCATPPYNWNFTPDDMKWYLDWLFVRGVNLLYPHAFFYSVNGEERFGERPPDVGPNNTFWPHYRQFADYIKRMCWLMTDSYNTTPVAILCEEAHLPWEPAKELFEHQIEFNYLEDTLLIDGRCRIEDGELRIEKQCYKVLLADSRELIYKPELRDKLDIFCEMGGRVIYWNLENHVTRLLHDYQEIRFCSLHSAKNIRISHVRKGDADFYLIVNEGDDPYIGTVEIPYEVLRAGAGEYVVEFWDAWNGTQNQVESMSGDDAIYTSIMLNRREAQMLCVRKCAEVDISHYFELGDWTQQEGLQEFSGMRTYEATVQFDGLYNSVILDLGEVHEFATVSVNDITIGTKMWGPYRFQIGDALRSGHNKIKIEVSNTPANHFEHAELVSGLLGPVKLIWRR